jgi:hypothetical protein
MSCWEEADYKNDGATNPKGMYSYAGLAKQRKERPFLPKLVLDGYHLESTHVFCGIKDFLKLNLPKTCSIDVDA